LHVRGEAAAAKGVMLVLKSACNGKDRRYGPTWKLSHRTIGDNAHLCHAKQGVIAEGVLGLGAFYLPIHVDGINSDSLLNYPSQNTPLKWPNSSFVVYTHFRNAARDKQFAMATVSVVCTKKFWLCMCYIRETCKSGQKHLGGA
jgi:hypothetical protein